MGCTRAHPRSTLPRPLFPSTRRRPPSSPSCLFPAAEVGVGWCFSPWRFLTPSPVPPRAPWSVPPFRVRVASPLSYYPLLLLVSSVSFASRPVGSGARRWRTAPDTDRTRSYGQPDGRRNARSCRTTDTCIRSRRRWHDTPVLLVPWCFPPATFPTPPPFPTLLS